MKLNGIVRTINITIITKPPRRVHLLRDDGGGDVKAGIVQIKSTIRFCLSNMNRIGMRGVYLSL